MLATPQASASTQVVPDWQRITLQPLTQKQTINMWGLDLKNPAQITKFSEDPAYAKRVMSTNPLTIVRVPIRSDIKGVDTEGHLNELAYERVVQAIRNVRLANPQVQIMASRKTVTDCAAYSDTRCLDFAPALKVNDQVSPARYGRLVAEYLKFMRRIGLRVSYLSIDNELTNNEGDLTPSRFASVLGAVRLNYPYTMPVILGNDGITGDGPWLKNAPPSVQIASAHSNSKWFPRHSSAIHEFATVAKQRGNRLWNTEMHWNGDPEGIGAYARAASTAFTFFDHTDVGYSGFMWWSWKQDGDAGLLWRAYLNSTIGARPIAVTDRDGNSTFRGTVTTRAYRNGNVVYLWVVNDTSEKIWNQRIFRTTSWTPIMNTWRQVGTKLVRSQQQAHRMNDHPTFSFGPHSISIVRLKVS